jgi:thiamine phosphate synthase YjbQ (UPF0047 family)
MHITASVFIKDDERGLHQDHEKWLEELAALAQERVTRSLTDDECRRYLHLEACPPAP